MKSTAYVVFSSPRSLPGPTCVPQGRDTHVVAAQKNSLQPPLIGTSLRDAVRLLVSQANQPMPRQVSCFAESGPCEYTRLIGEWMNQLTPAQLARRYALSEVIVLAGLKGQYREAASARYVGEALRRCGFVTKRDWTTAGRNKRYWVLGDGDL